MDKLFLNSIPPGNKVRLRDDVYQHVKIREWIFTGLEKDGTILLSYETHGYIWEAKVEDIDWEEYRKK
jgi:hypothetical protein